MWLATAKTIKVIPLREGICKGIVYDSQELAQQSITAPFLGTCFRNLRRVLIPNDCWAFGDEGSETEKTRAAGKS